MKPMLEAVTNVAVLTFTAVFLAVSWIGSTVFRNQSLDQLRRPFY